MEFENGTALDASRLGGPFRYVNHSCEPNAFLRRYRGRVEFYALRRIGAGEEVTCDSSRWRARLPMWECEVQGASLVRSAKGRLKGRYYLSFLPAAFMTGAA